VGLSRIWSAADGEPYWRQWPLPNAIEEENFVSLDATVARFEQAGVANIGIIAASPPALDWG